MDFIIYTINKEIFEEGERDPFFFDDIVEKTSDKYFPFSGTVAKPIYFLFVDFVNRLLQEKDFVLKSKKQKNEIKIKLEKLLVYCWKIKTPNLRSQRIIGNSFSKQNIDPLTANNWVKQTSFKIYTGNNIFSETSDYYWRMIGIKQNNTLKEFLNINKNNPSSVKQLQAVIKQLMSKKLSLFSNHLFLDKILKKRFLNELKTSIKQRNNNYFSYVSDFFSRFPDAEEFWRVTLENTQLPFLDMNQWFSSVVHAVNDDINGKNSELSWKKANKVYEILKRNQPHLKIDKKPNRGNWFEIKNGKYKFTDKLLGNKDIWERYMSRQDEVDASARFFYSFRHYAFKQLLKELT